MDKINQIKDKFNRLTSGGKLLFVTVIAMVLIIFLFFILALNIPKVVPKKVLPPIPVFNPTPSARVGTFPAKPGSNPSVSQLQGLSVTSPVIKDNFIYYLSDGGTTFYKTSLDGKDKQQLTDTLVAQIKQVIWSPDKSSAILKMENNKYFLGKNNSQFFSEEDENLAITNWYYNFSDKSFKKLDSKIIPISFSPDGSKLAYIKEGEQHDLNRLFIANPDGSDEQFILTLEESIQDSLTFLDKDNLISFARPHGYGRNFLYITNLATKTSQKLTSDGFTFGANPSPKGNLVLAQTVKPDPDVFYKNFLSVVEVQNKQLTVLDIQTSPDLAAWSQDGNNIYAFESSKLWVIDANSLSKQLINLPLDFQNLKVDGSSMLVSSDNTALFFASEGKLYSLQLKL